MRRTKLTVVATPEAAAAAGWEPAGAAGRARASATGVAAAEAMRGLRPRVLGSVFEGVDRGVAERLRLDAAATAAASAAAAVARAAGPDAGRVVDALDLLERTRDRDDEDLDLLEPVFLDLAALARATTTSL